MRPRLQLAIALALVSLSKPIFAAPHSQPAHGATSGPGPLPFVLVAAVVLAIIVGVVLALRARGDKKPADAVAEPPTVPSIEPRAVAVPIAPTVAKPPERQTWKERASAAGGHGDAFFFKEPTGKALLKEMLEAASKGVEGGVLAETTDPLPTMELRGSAAGAPFRAAIELAFGSLKMTVLSSHPVGALWVERDMEKVPTADKPNDPWAMVQLQRVFVGKGVFIPGPNQDSNIKVVGNDASDSPSLDERLVAWKRLPSETQEAIVAEMGRLDLSKLRGLTDRITASMRGTIGSVEDPVSCIVGGSRLLGRIQTTLSAPDAAPGAPHGMSTVTCKYCRSLFVFALGATACPNCGAAASAG